MACALGLALMRHNKTMRALHLSEQKLQAMLQSIGEPIYMKDWDLNIIWANDIAKPMLPENIQDFLHSESNFKFDLHDWF